MLSLAQVRGSQRAGGHARRLAAAQLRPKSAAATPPPADWPNDEHRRLANIVCRIPPSYLASRGPTDAVTRFVAHPDRAETCVCGWWMPSTLGEDNHDRVHHA